MQFDSSGNMLVGEEVPTTIFQAKRRIKVTSAQILALNATPIELVRAPGSGQFLVFDGCVMRKDAGTAYAGVAGGEDLVIRYADDSGHQVGRCETTGFLDAAGGQNRWVNPYSASSAASQFTPEINQPLVLHLLSGEITTGNTDLDIEIYYRVVKQNPV